MQKCTHFKTSINGRMRELTALCVIVSLVCTHAQATAVFISDVGIAQPKVQRADNERLQQAIVPSVVNVLHAFPGSNRIRHFYSVAFKFVLVGGTLVSGIELLWRHGHPATAVVILTIFSPFAAMAWISAETIYKRAFHALDRARMDIRADRPGDALNHLSNLGTAALLSNVVILRHFSGRHVLIVGLPHSGKAATAAQLLNGIPGLAPAGHWTLTAHWHAVLLFVHDKIEQLFGVQHPTRENEGLSYWQPVHNESSPGGWDRKLVTTPFFGSGTNAQVDAIVYIDVTQNPGVEDTEPSTALRQGVAQKIRFSLGFQSREYERIEKSLVTTELPVIIVKRPYDYEPLPEFQARSAKLNALLESKFRAMGDRPEIKIDSFRDPVTPPIAFDHSLRTQLSHWEYLRGEKPNIRRVAISETLDGIGLLFEAWIHQIFPHAKILRVQSYARLLHEVIKTPFDLIISAGENGTGDIELLLTKLATQSPYTFLLYTTARLTDTDAVTKQNILSRVHPNLIVLTKPIHLKEIKDLLRYISPPLAPKTPLIEAA
jgi:hypothetical protein